MRMVRIGKWKTAPLTREAVSSVETFLKSYFQTPTVWTRREHGAFVVAVQETAQNTEKVEEFRFSRTMPQRFLFAEANETVEVQLPPL